MKPILRNSLLPTLIAIALLLVTSCGGESQGSGTSKDEFGVKEDSALHESLPQDVRADGTLVMVTDATMGPPYGYFGDDNKTIEGVDVDLMRAVSSKLGLVLEVKNVKFDSIIPGLQGHRYDLALTAMLDTKERQKQVTFVDVLKGGSSFMVLADSELDNFTPSDACGHTIGAQTGSVEAAGMAEQSKKCQAEGKPPVKLQQFPEVDKALLALRAQRIEAFNGATGMVSFITKKDQKVRLAGTPYNQGIQGIAFPKDSELVLPVKKAVEALMKDGTYEEITDKYGMKDLTVDRVTVNLK